MHYNRSIREVGSITEDEKDRHRGSLIFFLYKKWVLHIAEMPILKLSQYSETILNQLQTSDFVNQPLTSVHSSS